MLYAIVSDIHANESAFRHVLQDAKSKGAETFVCLGDTVGYGPLPENTVNLVRATCGTVLAGNHDDAVAGRINPQEFIELAGDAVKRHREALSKPNLDWLRTLPYVYNGDGFLATHGSFTVPEEFYYVENEADAQASFDLTDAPLLFVGHTHTPELFLTGGSGKVYRMGPTDFALEPGKRYLVNPGSVGYPRERDGSCQSSYVLYDSVRREVTFHYLPFAVSSVMQRGTGAKAPRKRLFAALALALAALIGGAVYCLKPKTVVRQEVVEVREDARLLIKRDAVPLTPDLRRFLPNLHLENGSKPVVLRILFTGGDGNTLFSDSVTVRKSRTKAYEIPSGAARAEISLLRLAADDQPKIAGYKPAFKP